jgi:hypothetical protein
VLRPVNYFAHTVIITGSTKKHQQEERKVRDKLGDLRVDGGTTVKPMLKTEYGGSDKMCGGNSGQWPAVENASLCSIKAAEVLTTWVTSSRRYPINGITTCCIPCTGCAILGIKLCGIR